MKKILFPAFIFAASYLPAQVAGPQSGKDFRTSAINGFDKSWTDIQNVAATDHQYATFGDLGNFVGSHTDYLLVSSFNFNIPAGSTINGITALIENSDPGGTTADYSIRIVRGWSITGTEHSSGSLYLTLGDRTTYRSYGGTTDLWGESWTATDINSGGFGIAVAAQRAVLGRSTSGRIDNIRLMVSYTAPFTLPLKLAALTATLQNGTARLSWTTSSEVDMDRFEPQRSADGAVFNSIGTIYCSNDRGFSKYSFTDHAPLDGTSFYRLKIVGRNGEITYSKTVTTHYDPGNAATIYPSPWKAGTALNIRNKSNRNLLVRFYNNAGETIAEVSTPSSRLPVETLLFKPGLLRYKVFDRNDQLAGSGILIVL